jgi:uncharacterized repeat protein (TIGR01451 family)
MKRKLVAFTTSLMLLLSVLSVGHVGAHPVIYLDPDTGEKDRSRNEWFDRAFELDLNDGREGAKPSTGHSLIARNNVGQGEFIFRDFSADQRVISTTERITESTDLDWFAITGEPGYVSFLIKSARIRGALADPPPEFMISVSTDQNGTAGNTQMPDGVNVALAPQAAWEHVIQTDFGTSAVIGSEGNFRAPRIWNSPAASSACTGCQAQMLGSSNGTQAGSFVEIKIPWARIGGQPTPDKFLRFTLTSYYQDHDLAVLPNDGFPTSALIDAASIKTNAQILGGNLDTYFDVHFDPNGDVFSPLLITEFNPNPTGSEPAGPNGSGVEWIEIVNVSTFPVQLSDYSIGDATRRGSTDAMLKFPSKSIPPGGVVIATQDKNKAPIAGLTGADLTLYSWAPTSGSADLVPNTTWSTKTTIGLGNTGRDQVVLTYGSHTIMDLVQYTIEGSISAPFIGHIPHTYQLGGAPEGNQYSLERCPVFQDTNNVDLDFLAHDGTPGNVPTPGVACPPVSGVDLLVTKAAATPAALAGSTVNFTIEWSNLGDGGFTSVLVTDTLPLHLTFDSASPAPDPLRSTATKKVWNFTNLTPPIGGTVGGTIVLTATLAANAPANVSLVNTAEVGENDPNRSEALDRLENNIFTASVTAIKPDLAVSSTWPGGALPNAIVDYVITYANNGTGVASNVLVTDTLPSGVNFISSTPDPDPGSTATKKVWSFDDLSPGQTGEIAVKVQITGTTNQQLTNLVQISGTPADDPGAPSADNSESRILVVGVIPNLTITTTDWPALARAGSSFCYKINYAYPVGSIAASDIMIKDMLPPGLSLVSQSSTAGLAFNGAETGELIWGPGTLNVGGSGVITVCVQIRDNVPVNAEVQNVVTISGSVDPDPTANDNTNVETLKFDKRLIKVYIPVVRK